MLLTGFGFSLFRADTRACLALKNERYYLLTIMKRIRIVIVEPNLMLMFVWLKLRKTN